MQFCCAVALETQKDGGEKAIQSKFLPNFIVRQFK